MIDNYENFSFIMTVCTSEKLLFLWEVSRRELFVQSENQSFESDTRHILHRILRALLWERSHNQGKSGTFAQKTYHDVVLPNFLLYAQEVYSNDAIIPTSMPFILETQLSSSVGRIAKTVCSSERDIASVGKLTDNHQVQMVYNLFFQFKHLANHNFPLHFSQET